MDDDSLASSKKGEIFDEDDFLVTSEKNFTSHYKPLIPWVDRMRRHVFPNGGSWEEPKLELYCTLRKMLLDAQHDLDVAAEQ